MPLLLQVHYLTLLPIPPASPELNVAENIWQYLRQTYLANRIFKDYDEIIAACEAWRRLEAETGRHSIDRYAKLGKHRSDSMKAGMIPKPDRSRATNTDTSRANYARITLFDNCIMKDYANG